MLKGYAPSTGAYSPDGWTRAGSVPALSESLSRWHCEGCAGGAITARDLSALLHGRGGGGAVGGGTVDGMTRVWSPSVGGEWRSISDLPPLRSALEALAPEAGPSWYRDKAEGGEGCAADADADADAEVVGDAAAKGRPSSSAAAAPPEGTGWTNEQQTFADSTTETEAEAGGGTAVGPDVLSETQAKELEAFLASTGGDRRRRNGDGGGGGAEEDNGDGAEDDGEEYESDGGTNYVRDWTTGSWIPSYLAPPPREEKKAPHQPATAKNGSDIAGDGNGNDKNGKSGGTNKKRKKASGGGNKFKARNARNWIYVSNLPPDTDEIEVAKYFGRVGVIDLDLETQHPKVKLYRHRGGAAARRLRRRRRGAEHAAELPAG